MAVEVSGKTTFFAALDEEELRGRLVGEDLETVTALIKEDYQDRISRVEMTFVPKEPGFFARRISPIGKLLNLEVKRDDERLAQ